MNSFMSVVVAAALIAVPFTLAPQAAHARTEKQVRDEAKGKAAKQKSAEKSAARKAAKKSKK